MNSLEAYRGQSTPHGQPVQYRNLPWKCPHPVPDHPSSKKHHAGKRKDLPRGRSEGLALSTPLSRDGLEGISELNLVGIVWRPQPDLNRCCRRERPVSWTRLDDGDQKPVFSTQCPFRCQGVSENRGPVAGSEGCRKSRQDGLVVGRAGFEPATLCLKGRYSTS